jgi:protein-tyrosine-phosphatase
MKHRVLFVCKTNGLQSPMAEALLKRLDSEHFDVISAGIDPGETHPVVVDVMKEIDVDLKGRVAKPVRDFLDRRFDFVITLCDRARFECPKFQEAELVHWQFDDPLTAVDLKHQKRMVRSLRDQIAQRVRLFALVQVRFAIVEERLHRESVFSA